MPRLARAPESCPEQHPDAGPPQSGCLAAPCKPRRLGPILCKSGTPEGRVPSRHEAALSGNQKAGAPPELPPPRGLWVSRGEHPRPTLGEHVSHLSVT